MRSIAELQVLGALVLVLSLSVTACGDGADSSGSETGRESSVQTDSSVSPTATPQDLRSASLNGQLTSVRHALEQGVDVNAADESGNTPLMLAAYNGHTEVVRRLLETGADLRAQNTEGRTALMFAATGSFSETVEVLLEAGADPNVTGEVEGWSALMFAAAEGRPEVVRTLLEYGADPSMTDNDGDTALAFAQDNGHSEVAEVLRQEGEGQ